MNQELIRRFKGIRVKLIKDNFPLYGKILEIEGDTIIFQTNTSLSAIRIDKIEEIIPVNNKGGR